MRPDHTETVIAALEESQNRIEAESLSHSWRRSAAIHRVDPASPELPHVLGGGELREVRESIESVVLAAQPELDRLHNIVTEAGYVTLFCNSTGVAVDHRGQQERAAEFRRCGIWLGGVWSESTEGTNGIGTCIVESRPVTIHQTQHFRTRNIGLSCSSAPVFDPDANLVAVVDVSCIAEQHSTPGSALVLSLVTDSARMIEERLFRERFLTEWIVAVAPHGEHPTALLAINRDRNVIGADRYGRARFNLDQRALASGTSVWTLFTSEPTLLQGGLRRDYPVRLRPVRNGETLFALVSTPLIGERRHRVHEEFTLATQPRRALLKSLRQHVVVNSNQGGLTPRTLRCVREYVADHLTDDLSLQTLARQAGLSVHHFARAFKASLGIPPHRYVLEQRLHKAAELLEQTDQSVTSIALALRFADQSHFCRSFQRLVGLTPTQHRRAHR